MLSHCDFSETTTAQTVDGRLVPDMVVNLPGGRHIIIDAKVPYAAYRQAVEATGDDERAARLKEHADQVKAHMVELRSRGSWAQFQPAPEFVFMFLPGEGNFSAALQHDPGLIEFGVTRQVIPASPLTLIALLRAVAYGWQQERIARNAEEVSALGRELYERIWRLAGHLDDLAKGLTRTVEAYNRTVGTIESRVLVTARRFKELGVSAAEPIPEVTRVERTPRPLQARRWPTCSADRTGPRTKMRTTGSKYPPAKPGALVVSRSKRPDVAATRPLGPPYGWLRSSNRSFSCRRSSSSCVRIYARIARSSRPSVDTK